MHVNKHDKLIFNIVVTVHTASMVVVSNTS